MVEDRDLDRLVEVLRGYGRCAVALSGGVDSSVVAKAAQLALGDRAVAVTAKSASVSADELAWAQTVADVVGIRHVVVETSEFANPDYVRNAGDRCYHCKNELYGQVGRLREQLAFEVMCSGANVDDMGDYRPGLVAAEEHSVRHPLMEAGFDKEMIRSAARRWGLPNWDKPAAPCLSSRIAVGVEATPERTHRVEEAERFLRSLGFGEHRVRVHAGELARIEVPREDLARLADPDLADRISRRFRELGFQFISVDIEGFRSGGLNVLVPAEMLRRHPSRSPDSK